MQGCATENLRRIPGLLAKIAADLSIDILRKKRRETPLEVDGLESQGFEPEVNPPLAQMGREETLLVRQPLERLSSKAA
jgi:hypothetical protein